jgi:hypothetical protein
MNFTKIKMNYFFHSLIQKILTYSLKTFFIFSFFYSFNSYASGDLITITQVTAIDNVLHFELTSKERSKKITEMFNECRDKKITLQVNSGYLFIFMQKLLGRPADFVDLDNIKKSLIVAKKLNPTDEITFGNMGTNYKRIRDCTYETRSLLSYTNKEGKLIGMLTYSTF